MTRLQKLQLAQSEKRAALGALLDAETTDQDAIGKLSLELRSMEGNIQAAILAGEDETVETRQDTPEGREMRDLIGKASIMDFVSEANGGAALEGAALELRQELLGDFPGHMPLEMLEKRADTVSNVGTAIQDTQQPIAGRVFARGSAEYLGVMSPTVPVGTVSYPRLSGGTTGDVRSPGVELDGAAAALTTEQIDPVRLTASYTYSTETLQKIRGFEEAIRRDLQAVLSDKRDKLAINGQAVSGADSPAVEGIISAIADPTNPGTARTALQVLEDISAAVDGKYAMDDSEVRMLMAADTYRYALNLQVPTSGQLLRDRLSMDRFRVSANMPATASTIATIIRYASGAGARGFFMPTWAGLEMIVDPYTLAKKGQRILTAVMHVGWQMVDAAAYGRLEWKIG